MEEYIVKGGKKLRLGYTTGSCAAAATKAAAIALLTGRFPEMVALVTPKGIRLELTVKEPRLTADSAFCAIEKDSGDDPDVTKGTLIFAAVSRSDVPGVTIDGGVGIGRVTKPGLDQPVGAAAINSVPRKMIREAAEDAMALADYHGGLEIVISAPEGEILAKRTFNPRLGIVGGISILGTTGIVEPMSEQALVDTIRVELRQRRASGAQYVLLTPGNYGSDFVRDGLGLDPALAVQTSNFIGDTLDICRELGFRGALLVGHIGKLVKLAGGMLNTHSKYGDCRMEILAAHGAAAGLPAERAAELLECVSCDDALRILREAGVYEETLERVIKKAAFHLSARGGEELETGAVLFSKVYGLLGRTENAPDLIGRISEETMTPPLLRLGIGCRKGVSRSAIAALVDQVLAENNIHPRAIKTVASIELKKEEPGLLAFCEARGWPVEFYSAEELAAVEGDFAPSDFVRGVTGVDNVCERAAMKGAERLLVRKTAQNGVTVAVASEHMEVRFG